MRPAYYRDPCLVHAHHRGPAGPRPGGNVDKPLSPLYDSLGFPPYPAAAPAASGARHHPRREKTGPESPP